MSLEMRLFDFTNICLLLIFILILAMDKCVTSSSIICFIDTFEILHNISAYNIWGNKEMNLKIGKNEMRLNI